MISGSTVSEATTAHDILQRQFKQDRMITEALHGDPKALEGLNLQYWSVEDKTIDFSSTQPNLATKARLQTLTTPLATIKGPANDVYQRFAEIGLWPKEIPVAQVKANLGFSLAGNYIQSAPNLEALFAYAWSQDSKAREFLKNPDAEPDRYKTRKYIAWTPNHFQNFEIGYKIAAGLVHAMEKNLVPAEEKPALTKGLFKWLNNWPGNQLNDPKHAEKARLHDKIIARAWLASGLDPLESRKFSEVFDAIAGSNALVAPVLLAQDNLSTSPVLSYYLGRLSSSQTGFSTKLNNKGLAENEFNTGQLHRKELVAFLHEVARVVPCRSDDAERIKTALFNHGQDETAKLVFAAYLAKPGAILIRNIE
jgi:hypothetical protein